MTEFYPVTEQAKNHIVSTIRAGAAEIQRAGWPGFPATKFPLVLAANINALIADGVIREHDVTKTRPGDPTRTITYRYLALVS